MPVSAKPVAPTPVGRLVFFALIVALSAAIASGSCTWCVSVDAVETGRETVAGLLLKSPLLAGALAFTIGSFYLLSYRKPPAARLFAIISVAAYIAGIVGAWYWFFFVPAGLALLVIIAGALTVRFTDELGHHTYHSWPVAAASGLAIAAATCAFVAGFWYNYDLGELGDLFGGGGRPASFNVIPFAIIAGAVPPLCASAGSWLCCLLINFYTRRWYTLP